MIHIRTLAPAVSLPLALVLVSCAGEPQPRSTADPCRPAPCQHGGVCTAGADSYSCACPAASAWTGTQCERCPVGWNEACDGCAAGYEPVEGKCVTAGPCSSAHPTGRCPRGATCDGARGRCLLDDPTLPCLPYWEATPAATETPLCVALHDPDFLLQRTGPGLPLDEYRQRFETVWTTVDDWYGAFASTTLDWNEVHTRYRARAETLTSKYAQGDLLARMLAELDDSHAGYLDVALDRQGFVLPWMTSPFGFTVIELGADLFVFDSTDSRVQPGDRVLSINGLSGAGLRTYWRERSGENFGVSSASAGQAMFVSSVLNLATDPLFVGTEYEALLGVELDRGGTAVFLGPVDAGARPLFWDPGTFAYYRGASPIDLQWTAYDSGAWGGNVTHYIGHAQRDGVAIMLLYNFLGEDDFARALREVVSSYPSVRGWVIDIRANSGGGPHEETLASFFVRQPVAVPVIGQRVPGSHPNAFDPCGECVSVVAPDATLQVRVPVAVLTSGISVSAGDFFAYFMAQEPSARLVGAPTAGGFGALSLHDPPDGAYSLWINWTSMADAAGVPLQGHSVVPAVTVGFTREDLVAGTDPVLAAALAWMAAQ